MKVKKKLLREKYDFLIQLNMNMHGKPAAVQNQGALTEIKNLLHEEDDSQFRSITDYHKYMTRQMQQKPAPFATYGQEYNVQAHSVTTGMTTTDVYTPKCKEMNDFIKDVKQNPCRYASQQRHKF